MIEQQTLFHLRLKSLSCAIVFFFSYEFDQINKINIVSLLTGLIFYQILELVQEFFV